MKKSKLRAALFLIHLRLGIMNNPIGWHDYMCHSSAKATWVGITRNARDSTLRRINARFVSIKLGRLPSSPKESAAWGYDPVGSVCGSNTDLIVPTRKELFNFWKNDLLKDGL